MREPSPLVRLLLSQLREMEQALRPADPATALEDRATARLLDRRETLTRRLSEEPNLSPADLPAKLTLLCARLCTDLNVGDAKAVRTYMLAESVRDGVG
ncbi:hypothetical protein HHL28_12175 [Aerophototrophica crusticola]|uniref:Uncharacterized protein n=1 Tax=Aerophototrophica crusticola TaxID=1709002 RepID=A0A858R8M4_9PROT|nr:hypothetical protein HHL28_12175 [Rhodospirillaceae bacterium B3]